MGGHHQAQLGAAQQVRDLGSGYAPLSEPRDHLPQRPRAWRGRLVRIAAADSPHALVVLGQVDELKPEGQRADKNLRALQLKAGYQLRQPVGACLVAAACRSPQGDRLVEQLHGRITVTGADDVVQNLGQQLLIARVVG